jgi:hypothetical protein
MFKAWQSAELFQLAGVQRLPECLLAYQGPVRQFLFPGIVLCAFIVMVQCPIRPYARNRGNSGRGKRYGQAAAVFLITSFGCLDDLPAGPWHECTHWTDTAHAAKFRKASGDVLPIVPKEI